jgi:mannan endo-1,4-beta-mannosidase
MRAKTRLEPVRASLILAAAAALLLPSCVTGPGPGARPRISDPGATRETQALFTSLGQLSGKGVLFGHHDDLAYGYRWTGEPGRSDVKEVTGSYPAVYGWDIRRLFQRDDPDLSDPARSRQLQDWILEAYSRGGVSTLCWHMPNPVNDSNAWDTARAVDAILPGGRLHADYRAKLDVLAGFFKGLKAPDGTLAPVIFRPFHEHTGDWFWWGRAHSDIEEFRQLWRFTVHYLRDEKGVHNLLYAYSTDVFDSEAAYLERYPGDDVIDLLGFDDYHSVKDPGTRDVFQNRLRLVVTMARRHGKLAALTETGLEGLTDPRWFTGTLLPAIANEPVGKGIVFALVWRNANRETDRPNHFYAAYPGHPSAPDMKAFARHPFILMEDELPDLYRRGADPR